MFDIDCHILTVPRDKPDWVQLLRTSLDHQPVNQHWLEGVVGDIGAGRARGYGQGSGKFVSFADSDDFIARGTFQALLEALESNPKVPYAWAGERMVYRDLTPMKFPPMRLIARYDSRSHKARLLTYVHGVVLYRREVLTDYAMESLRLAGSAADGFLAAYAAGLGSNALQGFGEPVPVPIVGRLWRQHAEAAHKSIDPGLPAWVRERLVIEA